MPQVHNQAIRKYVTPSYTLKQLEELAELLNEKGTLDFKPLANGLYPAALAHKEEHSYTGYHNVWVRDNVHVAWGHFVGGDRKAAARCVRALAEFFWKHQDRFDSIIDGLADKNEPMERPHIRFNGDALAENMETWPHAQNDALGYFLWIFGKLISCGEVICSPQDEKLITLFLEYFHKIEFWQDEDSGHWEEVRKVAASSIGAVVAGLHAIRPIVETAYHHRNTKLFLPILDELLLMGRESLNDILPWECKQETQEQQRVDDAALLFLIYPLDVVTHQQAEQIIRNVKEQLQGEYGIKRYLGDSYWCDDYKDKLQPEDRTADVSEDMSARDSMLTADCEAQWCIFDPILSIIYGKKYLTSGKTSHLEEQIFYFHRTLGQITTEDSPMGGFRCPESYYKSHGVYIPNDITPLYWTQSHLWQAIVWMKRSMGVT